MLSYISVINDENRRCWVRCDEIGTFFETSIFPPRKQGRPRADERIEQIPVVVMMLRNGNKLNARYETCDTIANKMTQATGEQFNWIHKAVFEDGASVRPPYLEPLEIVEEIIEEDNEAA